MSDSNVTAVFPPVGRFEAHLIAPPQILGCERIPFLTLVGIIAFLIIVVFGINVTGVTGGLLMFLGGVRWLRAIFEIDPYYFAMRRLAIQTPRSLPAEHPPAYMKAWAFVGYDDPPSADAVFVAWLNVIGVVLMLATVVWAFTNLIMAGIVFASLMTAIGLWVFSDDLMARVQSRHR